MDIVNETIQQRTLADTRLFAFVLVRRIDCIEVIHLHGVFEVYGEITYLQVSVLAISE